MAAQTLPELVRAGHHRCGVHDGGVVENSDEPSLKIEVATCDLVQWDPETDLGDVVVGERGP